MFPNGQADTHSMHLMQRSVSTSIAAVRSFLASAWTGHTLTQAASSHWRQRMGTFSFSEKMNARRRDLAGRLGSPWEMAHASSHVLHPVQREGVTTSVLGRDWILALVPGIAEPGTGRSIGIDGLALM